MVEKGKQAADLKDAFTSNFEFQAEDSGNGRKKSAAATAPAGRNRGRETT